MTIDSIQYKEIIFTRAQAEDDIHLRHILSQNEMESWIKLSFEREPDYFAADNLMGESYSTLAYKRSAYKGSAYKKSVYKENNCKEIMGMYSCSFLPVRINGLPQYIGYLGGLRIVKKYRNKLRYVKNGYDSIAKLIPEKSKLPWWFSSIASDNKAAKKLLEAGLKDLPDYSPVGDIKTLAISANQAKKNAILQALSHKDIDELIAFYTKQTIDYQFAPVLTAQWLAQLNGKKGLTLEDFFIVRQKGVIVVCLALWDQRSFKQTRVKGYQFPLNKLRALYNLFATLTKRTVLPKTGDTLEQLYVSFVACAPQGEALFITALQDALCKVKERNATMAVIGLSTENPLLALIEKHFHSHSYQTCIETINWSKQDQPDLNGRKVQPEVALL